VGGALTVGSNLTVSGNIAYIGASGSGTGGGLRVVDDGGTTRWLAGLSGVAGARDYIIYDIVSTRQPISISSSTGVITIAGTTASTSTSSGALVVGNGTSGGLGVGGAINAGGAISTFTGGVTRTSLNTDGTMFWGVSANLGVLTWDTNKARVGAQSTADFALTTGTSTDRLQISGSTGVITIPGTTASNSASSGALVVGNGTSGGLGVGGSIHLGENLNLNSASGQIVVSGTGNTANSKEVRLYRSDGGDWAVFGLTGTAYAGSLTGLGNSEAYIYNANPFRIFIGTAATNRYDFASNQFKINATTASTGTSSGALVVSGGVGVAGAVYAGGNIDASGGADFTSVAASFARISTVAAAPRLTLVRSGSTSNRRAFDIINNADGLISMRFINDDLSGSTLAATISYTGDFRITGTLQVGNTYASGAPTATGYIVIKDSTGTSYKIPAVAL
jgi:hypothetical protein